MYLLKNSENTQELKVGSSLELEVYKIMKKISKIKGVDIKKRNSKNNNKEEELIKEYSIEEISINIIDGAIINVGDEKVSLDKLEQQLENLLKINNYIGGE